ncbi:uncharacterized protein VTP21DRAFT_612 [Calcarisporiella thermophila]|uniref:uncharacterized protein n=1 Tax=Calcarisporiella thermophila TaxID=911321 RepID=UPI0037445E76
MGIRWLPLESNPQVMNEYVYKLGISKEWAYTDIWGLDEELLDLLPQPVIAVIMLFPVTEKYLAYRRQEDERIGQQASALSHDIVFFKQTISNACGTMGLLHSIANNDNVLGIEEGSPLDNILKKCKTLTPEERAKALEEDDELAQVHMESAQEGQTKPPNIEDEVDLHFVCFVEKDGHIFELDGARPGPIDHGECTDLLHGSVKVVREYIERDPERHQFTLIALAPNQEL